MSVCDARTVGFYVLLNFTLGVVLGVASLWAGSRLIAPVDPVFEALLPSAGPAAPAPTLARPGGGPVADSEPRQQQTGGPAALPPAAAPPLPPRPAEPQTAATSPQPAAPGPSGEDFTQPVPPERRGVPQKKWCGGDACHLGPFPSPPPPGQCRSCEEQAEIRVENYAFAVRDCSITDANGGNQTRCVELVRDAWPKLKAASQTPCAQACQGCLIHAAVGGWMIMQETSEHFLIFVKSFLATQPLATRLMLWTYDSAQVTSLLEEHLGRCSDTLTQWRSRISISSPSDVSTMPRHYTDVDACVSDMIRFHILLAYGGIYIDTDSVILDDLTPICNSSFSYNVIANGWGKQWNTAIVGASVNNTFIQAWRKFPHMENCVAWHPKHYVAEKSNSRYHKAIGTDRFLRFPKILPNWQFDPGWGGDKSLKGQIRLVGLSGYGTTQLRPLRLFDLQLPSPFHDGLPGVLVLHLHGVWAKKASTRPAHESTCTSLENPEPGGPWPEQAQRALDRRLKCCISAAQPSGASSASEPAGSASRPHSGLPSPARPGGSEVAQQRTGATAPAAAPAQALAAAGGGEDFTEPVPPERRGVAQKKWCGGDTCHLGPFPSPPPPGQCRSCEEQAEIRVENYAFAVRDCSITDKNGGNQSRCVELVRDAWPKLKAASQTPCARACQRCLIHAAVGGWVIAPETSKHFILFVKSFWATQPPATRLMLWTYNGSQVAALLDEHLGRCDDTVTQWRSRISISSPRDVSTMPRSYTDVDACVSDMIRFHILLAHGGIYIDADSVILDDLSPICNASFSYNVIASGWGKQWNTAIVGAPVNNTFIQAWKRFPDMHRCQAWHPRAYCAAKSNVKYHKAIGTDRFVRFPKIMPNWQFDPDWGGDLSLKNTNFRVVKLTGYSTFKLRPLRLFDPQLPSPFYDGWPGVLVLHLHGKNAHKSSMQPANESTCASLEDPELGGTWPEQAQRALDRQLRCCMPSGR